MPHREAMGLGQTEKAISVRLTAPRIDGSVSSTYHSLCGQYTHTNLERQVEASDSRQRVRSLRCGQPRTTEDRRQHMSAATVIWSTVMAVIAGGGVKVVIIGVKVGQK